MDEKKRSICNICFCVGIVASVVYIILAVTGSSLYFRLIFAGIATIAYIIKFCVEFSSKESCKDSVFLIVACLIYIVFTVLQLI